MVTRRYRAVIFDLFGTLVHFRAGPDPRLDWLREPFAAVAPAVAFDAFRTAVRAVSMEIVAGREPEHREVSSGERFARALARMGADPGAAEALSAAHMRHLASVTELPAGHAEILGALAARHRLAVVSNFDHAPTARLVLARHAIDRHLAVTVISADVGRRKPHPAIFEEALRRLELTPGEALHVGDTHADDVVGALAAGLDVAWLGPPGADVPRPPPTFRIATLGALRALLAD